MERLYRILRLWDSIQKNIVYVKNAKVYWLSVFKEAIHIHYCFDTENWYQYPIRSRRHNFRFPLLFRQAKDGTRVHLSDIIFRACFQRNCFYRLCIAVCETRGDKCGLQWRLLCSLARDVTWSLYMVTNFQFKSFFKMEEFLWAGLKITVLSCTWRHVISLHGYQLSPLSV